jgi:hypothetical protein
MSKAIVLESVLSITHLLTDKKIFGKDGKIKYKKIESV